MEFYQTNNQKFNKRSWKKNTSSMKHGMKDTKVHNVRQFEQTLWLAEHNLYKAEKQITAKS